MFFKFECPCMFLCHLISVEPVRVYSPNLISNLPDICQCGRRTLKFCVGRDSSVGKVTDWGLDDMGIECQWGRDFPYPSSRTLGPTHPPLRWVPGLFFLGVMRSGHDVDHPRPCGAEVKERVELYSWPHLG